MALNISDEAKVQMPMKTVASLIALVAIGTWAFFGYTGKIKSTLNSITNYGEGSRRKHGVQNKMASWITRILTPLIQNNLC